MREPKTYYLETYGCQMNLSDSELVESLLVEAGLAPVAGEEAADLILLNTCGVREHAEQRVLARIAALRKQKERDPGKRIIILGCMAQRLGQSLLEQAPWLEAVVGPDNYRMLPSLVREPAAEGPSALVDLDRTESYAGLTPARHEQRSAWVPIMRGCDNFCAYCIVPYVRGRERSADPEEIERLVRSHAAGGVLEVVLLGQNVNSYRHDGLGLAGLLRRLETVEGLRWIRFLTSHPRDLSDEIIAAMADCPKVCEHLHLPVQAGSDRVLKLMNRGYDRHWYLDRVRRLRERLPRLALTTDLLVGFPGERPEDFLETVSLMEEVRFDYAYTFKYSTRPGTRAEGFPDQVEEPEKQQRLDRVLALQLKHTRRALEALAARELEVLFQAPDRNGKGLLGKTRTHFTLVAPAGPEWLGKIGRVRVTGNTGMTLLGEIAPGAA